MDWFRFFRRKHGRYGALPVVVERAVEAQVAFERTHPVRYDAEVRERALVARIQLTGKTVDEKTQATIREVAHDWEKASRAAEEVP